MGGVLFFHSCVEYSFGWVLDVHVGVHCGALDGSAGDACTQQRVQERGFSNTGLPQNGDFYSMVVVWVTVLYEYVLHTRQVTVLAHHWIGRHFW